MTAYERGRRFEYRVQEDYRKRGWVTIRSGGSHGPCDLIAAKGGEIRVLQCKADGDGYLTPAERAGLRAVAAEFGGIPIVAYRHGRKIAITELEEK